MVEQLLQLVLQEAFSEDELSALVQRALDMGDSVGNPLWWRAYQDLANAADRIHSMKRRSTVFPEEIEDILSGKKTVEEVLQEGLSRAQRDLAREIGQDWIGRVEKDTPQEMLILFPDGRIMGKARKELEKSLPNCIIKDMGRNTLAIWSAKGYVPRAGY